MKKRFNFLYKAALFILGDAVVIFASSLFVFLLLDSFTVISTEFPRYTTAAFILYSLISLGYFKMYQVNWNFTGLREALFISLGLLSGLILTLITLLISSAFSLHHFSYSLMLFLVSVLTVGTFRVSRRLLKEILTQPVMRKRAIIFGAGNAADQLLRDFSRHHHWSLNVVAIFDDNEKLHGLTLHGIPISGDRKKMLSFLKYADIDELIIAIPSISKSELKRVMDEINNTVSNLKVKVLPSYHLLSDNPVGYNDVRRISIEDVLGREPVRINQQSVTHEIQGKKVLITGAGGSIGREIVKQCMEMNPAKLIALDVDETELFHLMNEYSHREDVIQPCVANVTDSYKMEHVFIDHVPQIIFHAAAYKHVPMMELFPEEAVKVNVGGTRILSNLSCKYGVEKFVLISTDKAVNPTNVMGATKSVAEKVCLACNDQCDTRFMAVRFGNVLGSRGSVVPLFISQIESGGPITITHKDIKRYFMTIPEAVMLVMQASVIGKGGEIFLLDMGEPVRIEEMAIELIRLHGLQPWKDIKIEYTGLRPGEKMFEELTITDEKLEPTEHKLINKVVNHGDLTSNEIDLLTDHLLRRVGNGRSKQARQLLRQIVPGYNFAVTSGDLSKEELG